jgi:hypothetical protein
VPPSGPERKTRADLALSGHTPGEQKICYIGTGDEEDEPHEREDAPAAFGVDDGCRGNENACVRAFAPLGAPAPSHDRHGSLRLVRGHTGGESRDEIQPTELLRGCWTRICSERERIRYPQIRPRRIEPMEFRRGNSDDGNIVSVDTDASSEHGRIAAVVTLPQRIADHGDGVRAIVFRPETATEPHRHAER